MVTSTRHLPAPRRITLPLSRATFPCPAHHSDSAIIPAVQAHAYTAHSFSRREFPQQWHSCDHYVYPEHRLGNLRRDNLPKMAASKQQRKFGMAKTEVSAECMRCEWRFACHGGCPKHRIHKAGERWHIAQLKLHAHVLRKKLQAEGITLKTTHAQELVVCLYGFSNWQAAITGLKL